MAPVVRARFVALGSEATVAVSDPGALAEAVHIVQDVLGAVDRACSRFRSDSELMTVNRAGGRPTRVGAFLRDAVRSALRAADVTDGDVDPTVGTVLTTLGYDRDFASVARTGGPVSPVARVPGWQLVEVDDDEGTVRIPAGAQLDLGATGKAFAADRAATRASTAVGCGVLVGLGGDVAVAGAAPPGGWAVGIADWHGAAPDELLETVCIDAGGLATSSTTVRCWVRGGVEMHHLVDPGTGRPAQVVWRTASVAAASCVDANTASTAAIIRGARAPAWLAEQRVPARLVRADGVVVRVGGWPSERVA